MITPEQTRRQKDLLPRGWGRFGKAIDSLGDVDLVLIESGAIGSAMSPMAEKEAAPKAKKNAPVKAAAAKKAAAKKTPAKKRAAAKKAPAKKAPPVTDAELTGQASPAPTPHDDDEAPF